MKQVLINLVGNGVKFTEFGEVCLTVSCQQSQGKRWQLLFAVRDTGVGIDPQRLAHIFAPFAQADGSITRIYGGTGLGLSISRWLVHLMGGDIQVKSRPGQGTTFSFCVWFEEGRDDDNLPALAADGEQGLASLTGVKVLLVEDNRINQQVAGAMLQTLGVVVEIAADGQEALALAQSSNFALILMDLQMPTMDGYEATRRLRQLAGLEEIPIVAMTANAREEDRERCFSVGMNDYLAKPVELEMLRAVLLRNLVMDRT